jgi:hypothetical protein
MREIEGPEPPPGRKKSTASYGATPPIDPVAGGPPLGGVAESPEGSTSLVTGGASSPFSTVQASPSDADQVSFELAAILPSTHTVTALSLAI